MSLRCFAHPRGQSVLAGRKNSEGGERWQKDRE